MDIQANVLLNLCVTLRNTEETVYLEMYVCCMYICAHVYVSVQDVHVCMCCIYACVGHIELGILHRCASVFIVIVTCSCDVGLLVNPELYSVVELICSLIAWTDRERSKLHLASPFHTGLFPHHLAGEAHYTSAELSGGCEIRLRPCQ